ncbi:histidine kinase [Actinoplanes sp. NPDC048796]|uniref:sensor histidine kinase n=1 Tax=Actinoplanes sp. NPDC048796 TaxID=3155640 RepID=UPI0033D983C5
MRQVAAGVAPAVVVAAVTVPQLSYHATHADPRLGAYVLFSVLLVVPLVWRRRFPLGTFAFAATVALAQWVADVRVAADLVLLIYLYTVASRCRARVAIAAAGVVGVGALLAAVRWPETGSWAGTGSWTETFLLLSGPVVTVLLLGVNARQRRDALRAAVEQAAVAERTRIAAEMHDVIAHSLAVMVTLSEGAARKQAKDPQRAGDAMRQVAETGRQALTETRRLLGIVHGEREEEGNRRPQPGLAQLGDLFERVRSTGLTVESAVTAVPSGMPPGAELTVYRIVQEALTNTLKHATAARRVSVAVTPGPGSVTVDVHDDGTPAPGRTDAGHGLAGMRERATVYAGTVTAGPDPRGGWRVHADLALPAEAPG